MKLAILLLALWTSLSEANTGELYGYGSRASSLGNTMLGGDFDGYATYYNPAANSLNDGVRFAYGMSYDHPHFKDIHGIVVNDSATSADGGNVTGNVDTEGYLDHFTQAIGFSYNFGEKWKRLALGALGTMPVARTAYLDTGEPFKPEYFNYRARGQRPEVFVSLSASPFEHWYAAVGAAISSSVSSSANYTISGASGTVSSGRLSTTLKPQSAPYFSALYDNDPWRAGLTVRTPVKYSLSVDIKANARVLGTANDFPMLFQSTSMLYYDPLEGDLAASKKIGHYTWMTLEADWLRYSQFEPATLTVTDLGSAVQLRNSVSSKPTFRDIVIPKIGVEHAITDATKLRAGYAWRPSPIKDSSGTGNLVDPESHIFTAGAGFDLKRARISERQIYADLHAQYHWLVKQSIKKADGNEAGAAGGSSRVGSPGYDIGGSIYGGGLSVTMLF